MTSARYAGICGSCDSWFPEGTEIRFDDLENSWIHDKCPEPPPTETCDLCFTQKSVNGSCLC